MKLQASATTGVCVSFWWVHWQVWSPFSIGVYRPRLHVVTAAALSTSVNMRSFRATFLLDIAQFFLLFCFCFCSGDSSYLS